MLMLLMLIMQLVLGGGIGRVKKRAGQKGFCRFVGEIVEVRAVKKKGKKRKNLKKEERKNGVVA